MHRTMPNNVRSILELGLLPGGPNCWEMDAEGKAVRFDVIDPKEEWRGTRSGGRSSTAGSRRHQAETTSTTRYVAMMSPVANSGNSRAVGDRPNMPFAIFFDVEEMLNSGVPLHLGYNGAVMCTAPVPPEMIVSVQDVRRRELVYSRILAKYKLIDVEDTPTSERTAVLITQHCRRFAPDAAAGEIACPFPDCTRTICPGYIHCFGCGRVVTYQIGAAKDESDAEMAAEGSGDRPSIARDHPGSGSGHRPSIARTQTGPSNPAEAKGTTAKAKEPAPPESIRLTREDRETVYGMASYDRLWRITKSSLKRCQNYHKAVSKDPTKVFSKLRITRWTSQFGQIRHPFLSRRGSCVISC